MSLPIAKSLHLTAELPPSVNHCYRNVMRSGVTKRGKKYTRRERQLTAKAEVWMEATALKLNLATRRQGWVMPPAGAKVVVELTVRWPDHRRRDTHNLHKLIADVLEGIVFCNDQYALLRDIDFTVDPANPGVDICCWVVTS